MTFQETTDIPGLDLADLRLNGFKVHALPASTDVPPVKVGRRDFYKIGLVNGDMTINYGGQLLDIEGTVLIFINPRVPHSLVRRLNRTSGYSCIFTETFISGRELQYSPLFRAGDNPVIRLNTEQSGFMTGLFEKILTVYNGDYLHKGELIKSCITLIIHEALRIQPAQHVLPLRNGVSRIAHLFIDLLERQFPIERSNEPLGLRTAQDYASHLSIHVNYLNRAVKEVTGKPTSAHIAARIIAEAKALLQHSDWSVAEIAYALGFEYPAYFNNYFKRLTGTTPNAFRKV
ncbi:helix-turn-helix domain-containing protein [Chitinophaga filiformis]|uniref:helix-turn-helix domain-containing protein n=1 Tax=Chitinophaga filiformis TaxID=104663 RepID=UPI001F29C657|nr:helix-turn-helix domain-containing protein [Chitinophaga filiformis]MCF6406242.1 helix-turn-helix domain-containing protein [Chitinophaga filiformis]